MTLPLTPQMLEAAYEFLRTTPPFKRWKLPSGAAIEFKVVADRKFAGLAFTSGRKCEAIHISTRFHRTAADLLETMAHEMCHFHQALCGEPARNGALGHGKKFAQRAALVCRRHSFDPKRF